jgi:crossover junction endodeoxyribonuclease RuvC
MTTFIGIDPGLNGAVAVLRPEIKDGGFVVPQGIAIYDTPTMLIEGEKTKHKYNTRGMANILRGYVGLDVLVILEQVHSMPKQGVASSFSFGEGLGMWEGIVAALGLPLEMVSPQRWKKAVLSDQGKDKDASRFRMMQMFPSVADQLSRKKDDGRADALCMAEYGRRLRPTQ